MFQIINWHHQFVMLFNNTDAKIRHHKLPSQHRDCHLPRTTTTPHQKEPRLMFDLRIALAMFTVTRICFSGSHRPRGTRVGAVVSLQSYQLLSTCRHSNRPYRFQPDLEGNSSRFDVTPLAVRRNVVRMTRAIGS